MNPLDTIASTAEAAFACDARGRIVAWNDAAEELLGHRADDAIGRRCHAVLDGKDLFGNRFCDEHCPIRSMMRRHEPVHQFTLNVRSARQTRLWAHASVFVLADADAGHRLVMHVLEPAEQAAADQCERRDRPQPAAGEPSAEAACPPLTTREHEILRLLAGGATTPSIARRLSISRATVRNHVCHILGKLNAHSRLEAVSLAIRHRML